MAKKPHKFEWNGVDIDTVLSVNDIRAICAQAAVESTGDLWHGKQRISHIEDGDGWTIYLIKDGLTGWNKLLTFSVNFTVQDAHTQITTTIENYVTLQQKAMFVPLEGKKMVAHHTYMQFAHKLANTVRAADATAKITVREGVQGLGESNPVAHTAAPASSDPITPPVESAQAEPTPVEPTPTVSAPVPPPPPPPPPPVPVPSAPATPALPLTPASSVPEQPLSHDSLDDSTRQVPRRSRIAKQWELVFPDGASVPLNSTVVVGRDPVSDDPTASILSTPDDERSVSKTHAMFTVQDGVVNVTDLHSKNGTFGVSPDGVELQCEPGVPLSLQEDWGVELGDFAIAVRRQLVSG